VNGYLISIIPIFCVSLMLAMSCYVILRSGEISFGQQAFFGVGAYSAGILTALGEWPLIPALLAGAGLAGLAAVAAGLGLTRMTAFPFSLTTLVLAEFAKEIFGKVRWTREIGGRTIGPDGQLGFSGIDYFYLHQISPLEQAVFSLAFAAGCVLAIVLWERSRSGKKLIAVATDVELAASVGIDPRRVRLTAFTLAGVLAGLGGALFAHVSTYLDHTNFSLMLGVHAVAYTLMGGIGSALGPVVGTAVDIVFLEALRVVGPYRMVAFGSLLVLVLVLRPQGLLGSGLVRTG
jgi:branched-chain amino acid transport system permease protein